MRTVMSVLVAVATGLAAANTVPSLAHAGPISGGGCRSQVVDGIAVNSCISYRDSQKVLIGDAYLTSLGGRSCVLLRLNFLVNGLSYPTFTVEFYRGPGYYPAQRQSVTRNSSTQTARTTVAVNDCSDGDYNIGTVSSLEQKW